MALERQTTPLKVVVKKVIRARSDQVFDAWTKPELTEKWFRKEHWSAQITNDLRVGGFYSQNMTSDESVSGTCQHRLHQGEYLEIHRPDKLVFTWNTPEVRDTRVTVELRDLGDSTEVTITHELLATDELRKGHAEGWEICLENLSRYFA